MSPWLLRDWEVTHALSRLTCQPTRRPTGRAKPLIGHKLDTRWQGRLYLVQVSDLVALKQLIYKKENTYDTLLRIRINSVS